MSDLEDVKMTSRSPTPNLSAYDLFTPETTPGPPALPNAIARLKKEALPAVVKLANSKGSEHLNKNFKRINGMFFQSYSAVGTAIGPSQWSPPDQDATIPQTNEQDRAVVRRLYDAMLDIDTALDTPNSPYRKRFTPGKETCYEPWTVEACAWEILNLVKSLHTKGFSAAIFDTHILADIGQTENWTFEQRIDTICRVVRNSKNVAVTLMKREKVWTIIGAPHKLYQSNLINTVSNKDRNLDVKNGRAARKGTAAPVLKRKASAEELKRRKAAKMDGTVSETSPASSVAVREAESRPTTPAAVPTVEFPLAAPTQHTPRLATEEPGIPVASPQAPTPAAATSEVETSPDASLKVRSGVEIQHAELLMGLMRK